MANDKLDGAKVSQELASIKDKPSLQAAMSDFAQLQSKESAGAFQQDLALINKSVDMKALHLDGFHITGNGQSDEGNLYLKIQNDSTKQVRAIDKDGQLWDPQADNSVVKSKDNIFTAVASAAPDASTGPKVGADAPPAPAPAPQVADTGNGTNTDAPAAANNEFGTHHRQFEVGDDKKPVYTAKHGDTYWSVAKDLLSKPDHTPTNTEIANAVKQLAAFNNKSDANKLMVGEKIALPIDPPAPPAPPAPDKAQPAAPDKAQPAAPEQAPTPAPGAPEKAPPAQKVEAQPPAAAAATTPVGFDMKAHGADLKPDGNVYSPLSPLGMDGAGMDKDKTKYVPGETKPAVTKDGVTTLETDFNRNDGYMFNWGSTAIKNVDQMKGDILQSRVTTYSSGADMSFKSTDAPVAFTGVTKVDTRLQDNGNYKTVVTASDGDHILITDAQGNVQMAANGDGSNAQYAAAPTSDLLASLTTDTPTPVAAVTPAPEVAPAVTPAPTVVADAGNGNNDPVP